METFQKYVEVRIVSNDDSCTRDTFTVELTLGWRYPTGSRSGDDDVVVCDDPVTTRDGDTIALGYVYVDDLAEVSREELDHGDSWRHAFGEAFHRAFIEAELDPDTDLELVRRILYAVGDDGVYPLARSCWGQIVNNLLSSLRNGPDAMVGFTGAKLPFRLMSCATRENENVARSDWRAVFARPAVGLTHDTRFLGGLTWLGQHVIEGLRGCITFYGDCMACLNYCDVQEGLLEWDCAIGPFVDVDGECCVELFGHPDDGDGATSFAIPDRYETAKPATRQFAVLSIATVSSERCFQDYVDLVLNIVHRLAEILDSPAFFATPELGSDVRRALTLPRGLDIIGLGYRLGRWTFKTRDGATFKWFTPRSKDYDVKAIVEDACTPKKEADHD